MKKGSAIILAAAFVLSCSSLGKDKKTDASLPVIRYINLRAVYGFMLNRDEKARQMNEKRDKLAAEIEENKSLILKDGADREALYRKLNEGRSRLQDLAEQEEAYKGKLLGRIQTAVRNVAESSGADFVFNLGDEVVYGKKKYDITEDVLREIERLESRSDPVSRQ
ncbi:MAG TPA: OmpH family outer membrane protein [Spirochaetota bacterium]|nr:OmpH family outer membrane protein [Spirochaetota bacterium]HRZ25342.1 OmpH family outer membrane protein [Spirochaetota bacterium]HSA14606.1 OmpH family outer membrane protein [Spirochaetota bacterium]